MDIIRRMALYLPRLLNVNGRTAVASSVAKKRPSSSIFIAYKVIRVSERGERMSNLIIYMILYSVSLLTKLHTNYLSRENFQTCSQLNFAVQMVTKKHYKVEYVSSDCLFRVPASVTRCGIPRWTRYFHMPHLTII